MSVADYRRKRKKLILRFGGANKRSVADIIAQERATAARMAKAATKK